MRLIVWLLLTMSVGATAHADDFFVDATHGRDDGDGSAERPWKDIQRVLDSGEVQTFEQRQHPYRSESLQEVHAAGRIKPGDRIVLRSGDYGHLLIRDHYNSDMVTIAAAPDAVARFSRIEFFGARNWTLQGLRVSASLAEQRTTEAMIRVYEAGHFGPSSRIVIRECLVYSEADSSRWSKAEWVARAARGIDVQGTHVQLLSNVILNTNFAIEIRAENAYVAWNRVEGFSGDGMRALASNAVFEYNLVKDSHDVDANHDDLFQSWCEGPGGRGACTVSNVVLRGNIFLNYENENLPHRATAQGIACFDGNYDRWVIENNVVATDHWHGISMYGVSNSRIVNNTVVDLRGAEPGPAWIKIGRTSRGRGSSNVVVRNNIVHRVVIESSTSVVVDHNIPPAEVAFVDAVGSNFYLQAGGGVDQGTLSLAPAIDADERPRPLGEEPDMGAYEYEPGVERPSPRITIRSPSWLSSGPPTFTGDASFQPADSIQGGCACSSGSREFYSAILFLLMCVSIRRTRRESG